MPRDELCEEGLLLLLLVGVVVDTGLLVLLPLFCLIYYLRECFSSVCCFDVRKEKASIYHSLSALSLYKKCWVNQQVTSLSGHK